MLFGAGLFDPILSIGPLWLVGLVLIGLCLLARWGGSLLYRYQEKRVHGDAKVEGDAASDITGAIFGLLAFILAFTFAMAVDRFDTRRALVTEEANAIGTTYLRASLFDEPDRTRLQATLREYAGSRITPSGLWDHEMEQRAVLSQRLRERFWNETRAAILPYRESELASYFVDSANNMIDVGTKREVAGRAFVPSRILDVTLLYLLVACAMLGYLLGGAKGARRHASTVLLVLFVIVITLVVDLDRPRSGTIQVPQRAMEDLVASLDRDAVRNAATLPAQTSLLTAAR